MEKKTTKKATSPKKATTSAPTKTEQGAKVAKNAVIEVIVTAEKFGNYKKGDVIKMSKTTADACVKNKAVKLK